MEKKGTVLLVEDNRGLLSVLKEFIEEWGFVVEAYRDWGKARDEIDSGLFFDVAIIDLTAESGKQYAYVGDDLIAYIRNKYQWEKPIVCISGYERGHQLATVSISKCDERDKETGSVFLTELKQYLHSFRRP